MNKAVNERETKPIANGKEVGSSDWLGKVIYYGSFFLISCAVSAIVTKLLLMLRQSPQQ